jgi:hypothetical protein
MVDPRFGLDEVLKPCSPQKRENGKSVGRVTGENSGQRQTAAAALLLFH